MMFKDFLNARLPVKSQSAYVEAGYGQVEPNHLSAQRTGQIYAQLPAKANINILEQGQFVKYNYAANDNGIGLVDFDGPGEWMMVFNEIKLYKIHPDGSKQWDCEFAMLKDDYQARIYSPYDYEYSEEDLHTAMYLNGKDEKNNTFREINQTVTADAPVKDTNGALKYKTVTIAGDVYSIDAQNKFTYEGNEYEINPATGESKTLVPVKYHYEDVTKDVEDIYEMGFTNDPWKKLGIAREKKMPAGTSMVPRVIKTNIGDIFTTNMINVDEAIKGKPTEQELAKIKVGAVLTPGPADGILKAVPAPQVNDKDIMKWQVVKVYNMPDGQRAVKVMRIQ